jgi:hypothetical protein
MDPEASADPGQARAAGEGDILVAEGRSPIVGWEMPPLAWISGSEGTGPRSVGSGWPFFRTLSSKAAQPFSPAVVIKSGRLRPQTSQPPSVCPWTTKESAWRGGPGELDQQGGGVYSSRHFPPNGLLLRAQGEGGE